MLALEIVCALTRDIAIVESAVIDGPSYTAGQREEIPTLEFFETVELGGHFVNWFGPSVASLLAMCRAVGFARVELLSVTATTASVACFRNWPKPEQPFTTPPPILDAVTNNSNMGVNVARDNDDYLTWWFACDEPLTRHDLQFEVGNFGCHAVWMTKREGNRWSANTILPPGLPQGWAEARMRTTRSPFTPAKRIAVDVPCAVKGELRIDAVQDGLTWNTAELSDNTTHVVLWIRGLSQNADRANVTVECNGVRPMVEYVGEPDENDARQVNVQAPPRDKGEPLVFSVRHAGLTSNPATIRG
jgi:hypothetical protein